MPHQSIPPFVIKAATIASLGGILFGYDLGCITGALPQMASTFSLTERQQEMVVSFLYLGGCLGAAIGGSLCDTAGRRMAILVTDIIFLLGAAILYFSQSLAVVLVGRIVMGFAVAVSAIADVSYLHEISPIEWRGSVVSVNEASISLGFLLAYTFGYFISLHDPVDGWRTIFGTSGLVAIIQFVGMLRLPESPVWLIEKGLIDDANAALLVVNGGHGWCDNSAADENGESTSGVAEKSEASCTTKYESINDSQPQVISPLQTTADDDEICRTIASRLSRMWATVSTKYEQFLEGMVAHRRQVTLAVFLAVAQQFCGHTNVLNYAPEIVQQIGLDSTHYMLGFTILIGTIKFLITCFVIWRIEFLGRRPLLLGGSSVIAVSTLILSIMFWHLEHGEDEFMTPPSAIASLVGMVGVAAGYAASYAPLTWLLISEMFHTKFRGRALGASTIITYFSAALVSFFFLSAQTKIGAAFPFSVYFVVSVLATVFAAVAVPDTGGKDPDEIEADMKQMRWWKWRDGEANLWQKKESETNLFDSNIRSSSRIQLV